MLLPFTPCEFYTRKRGHEVIKWKDIAYHDVINVHDLPNSKYVSPEVFTEWQVIAIIITQQFADFSTLFLKRNWEN